MITDSEETNHASRPEPTIRLSAIFAYCALAVCMGGFFVFIVLYGSL